MQEQPSAQPDATIETTIPHTSDIVGVVNAPPSDEIRIYKSDGRSTVAKPEELEAWLAEGWTRERRDIPTLASAIGPLAQAAAIAVQAYVSQAQEAGSLTKAVQAQARAAHMAMTELVVTWHHLDQALQDGYQTEENAPATLSHPVLGTVKVDPGQKDYYADGLAAWDAYRAAHPHTDADPHPESLYFYAHHIPLYKTALPATPQTEASQ